MARRPFEPAHRRKRKPLDDAIIAPRIAPPAAHGGQIRCPAPRPCESCPYRRDVPSGIWAPDEYAKLPAYDQDTALQPVAVFLCHQQDGRVCAGWVGCHGGANLLGIRLAAVDGRMAPTQVAVAVEYSSPVPLFASGAEAAAHGTAEVARPGPDAVRAMAKLLRQRGADPAERA